MMSISIQLETKDCLYGDSTCQHFSTLFQWAMQNLSVTLKAFGARDFDLKLDCQIALSPSGEVSLKFTILGDNSLIDFGNEKIFQLQRRPDLQLWERTCFEFFWADSESAADLSYFEVNLVPQGYWNIYGFTGYRQGQKSIDTLVVKETSFAKVSPNLATMEAKLLLGSKFSKALSKQKISVSPSVILNHQSNEIERSYWANQHRGDHPDFHLYENFVKI